MDRARMKFVYAVTSQRVKPAPGDNGSSPRKYWNRVGVAFVNRDGSLSVKLEALPVSGELHIRDYVPDRETPPDGPRATPASRTSVAA